MNFSQALTVLKRGGKVCRSGWNGKGQYIELATCISYKNAAGEIVNVNHDAIGNQAIAFVGTSGVQIGWLASQSDMLADDWEIHIGKGEKTNKDKRPNPFEALLAEGILMSVLASMLPPKDEKRCEEPKGKDDEPDCETCPVKDKCDYLQKVFSGKKPAGKAPKSENDEKKGEKE